MEHKNLGVIIEQKPTDYVAGTLPYEVLNPSGNWTPYLPSEETQALTHFTDSMACVTYSCLNVIETIIKFKTGQTVNFSDRFIAKLSGTTIQGNTVQRVLDTINKYGLVLEEDWPANPNFNWDAYYAPIPQSVLDKASKNIKVQYEFHYPPHDYEKELKHVPLEMIIEKNVPYHSVEMVNTTQQFDSYFPNLKPQKSIYVATKILVTGITSMNPNVKIYKNGSEYQLAHRATSPPGFAQQLVDAGCNDLIGPDGNPDFAQIDKIAQVL